MDEDLRSTVADAVSGGGNPYIVARNVLAGLDHAGYVVVDRECLADAFTRLKTPRIRLRDGVVTTGACSLADAVLAVARERRESRRDVRE